MRFTSRSGSTLSLISWVVLMSCSGVQTEDYSSTNKGEYMPAVNKKSDSGSAISVSAKRVELVRESTDPPFFEEFDAEGGWVAFYNERAQQRFEGKWTETETGVICVTVERVKWSDPLLGQRICRLLSSRSGKINFSSLMNPNRLVQITLSEI
jgi:hypothetical protein